MIDANWLDQALAGRIVLSRATPDEPPWRSISRRASIAVLSRPVVTLVDRWAHGDSRSDEYTWGLMRLAADVPEAQPVLVAYVDGPGFRVLPEVQQRAVLLAIQGAASATDPAFWARAVARAPSCVSICLTACLRLDLPSALDLLVGVVPSQAAADAVYVVIDQAWERAGLREQTRTAAEVARVRPLLSPEMRAAVDEAIPQ